MLSGDVLGGEVEEVLGGGSVGWRKERWRKCWVECVVEEVLGGGCVGGEVEKVLGGVCCGGWRVCR